MTTPAACPRCATPFECGIDTGDCWCREVTLDPATRAAFAEYYEGCLCRDCLTAMEDRPATPSVRQFLAAQLRRKLGRGRAAAGPPSG
ncbi:MAG: cysteine-rich CWC family protein [Solirubrobacteraceae bacterium]|nr:cysteine-rich CWC family protein [Solirubrobacteraceae bacterium]